MELDPEGRGKELVGKGLDTVRPRLVTVLARQVILHKMCENLKSCSRSETGVDFTKEIPLHEISEILKVLLKKMRGGTILKKKSL